MDRSTDLTEGKFVHEALNEKTGKKNHTDKQQQKQPKSEDWGKEET